jgi:hypothetical protein
MANIKHSLECWEKARLYFEAGQSLSKISNELGIDKGAISKKAKSEGWVKNNREKQQLILDDVRVRVAKSSLSKQEVAVHESIVDERTRALVFFANITRKNLSAVDNMLDNESTLMDRLTAQTIYEKGRTTWLGKDPSNQTNIQNNVVSDIKEIKLVPLS